jgi:transcriptional regulator with XRE-family HTH domain
MTTALKSARIAKGWSQAQLAHHLNRAAQSVGEVLPSWESMKRQIARWEAGYTVPSASYRNFLAQVYGLPLSALGLESPDDSADAAGLFFDPAAPTQAVIELWEADMNRRDFLLSTAVGAVSITTPGAVATGIKHSRASGSVQVGTADLDMLRDVADAYRRADNRSGGGVARVRLVRTLNYELKPLLLNGRYNETTGLALKSLTAEMTSLAGWMAYDCGLHELSQRYLLQALGIARSALNEPLAGEILAAMAHQSAYLGRSSDAINAARAAAESGKKIRQLQLVAEASVLEAQGHAMAGDESSAAAALTRAESALDHADNSASPHFLQYLDEAYLAAKFGHVFKSLGAGTHTVKNAERSLDMKAGYERGRAFNLALLAHGHALNGDAEEAVRVGSLAADSAASMTSMRAIGYVQEIAAELKPYDSVPGVKEFRKRARYLRTA